MNQNRFTLPNFPYDYKALEPYLSEQLLTLHHLKHHQAYVNGANMDLEKLEKAREEGSEVDLKAILKELSFNLGGHILHSLFWENLAPEGQGGQPNGHLAQLLSNEFGSLERFQKEFAQTANTVEGSGWAVLTLDTIPQRPLLMQIEKHNHCIYPGNKILLVLDVWEHAYYLDYKNERAKFIEAFWKIVNWNAVNDRL